MHFGVGGARNGERVGDWGDDMRTFVNLVPFPKGNRETKVSGKCDPVVRGEVIIRCKGGPGAAI